ncbi:dTDP-4-dehydrorhamnose reductase [Salisaeta longa]|uniref:dTDP-4-dehydrorhamnose reductase n=1 Tax=Salisaeta longa TaxID=503170 RepID=UPI0003B76EC1|nr:dTDP-4-dehydrorhamnose reductase [Salisaeta longa]
MDKPTLLLLGATGQVGQYLHRTLQPVGTVAAPGRERANLEAPATLRAVVRDVEPSIIVNAAAYTAVDDAEEEAERAHAINAVAPGVLAEEARRLGAWLVHYSTDYVFDGTHDRLYTEDDPVAPVNVYGETKAAGEAAVQAAGGRFVTLRTSWVYSPYRSNFLRTMLRLAETHDTLRVVNDQYGSPTWAGWIAEATTSIVQQLAADDPTEKRGVYHLCSQGCTSWHGFAEAIMDAFDLAVAVQPIPTRDYPTPAARPAHTAMTSAKAKARFGCSIPSWRTQLAACAAAMRDAPTKI